MYFGPYLAVSTGVTYTATYYVRIDSGTLSANLRITTAPVTLTAAWQKFTETFTSPSTTTRQFGIYRSSTAVPIYIVAQIEVSATPSPYVKTTGAARTAELITLSEPLTWAPGQTHYIGLRAKDGSLEGPIEVTQGANEYEVVPQDAYTTPIYTGSDYERTHVVFGWGETWRQQARVISATPRGLHQVEILAVNEDPSVHTADVGAVAPPVNSSQLANLYTAPIVLGLTVRSQPGEVSIMLLSWQAAQGADHYLIEQSAGDGTWTRCGETAAANYTAKAIYGNATLLRVAAVGLTRGPWVTVSYADGADYMWSANDSDLMWNADDTTAMWKY